MQNHKYDYEYIPTRKALPFGRYLIVGIRPSQHYFLIDLYHPRYQLMLGQICEIHCPYRGAQIGDVFKLVDQEIETLVNTPDWPSKGGFWVRDFVLIPVPYYAE